MVAGDDGSGNENNFGRRLRDMKKAFGIMPPMITVWKDDESFDERRTVTHLEWLISEGITSVSFCGSTGENISMSPEDVKRNNKTLIEAVNHRIPCYPATGFYSTKTTIEVSQAAEAAGADGVLVIPPYYLNPYKEAVLDHFRALRRNIGIDIMLYDNPWFAGYKMSVHETAQLCSEGVIQAIKCAHGDACDIHDLKYLCGDKLNVFYGHDYNGIETLFMGADGWLTGSQNVFPREMRKLYDQIQAKDYEGARKFWYETLMPFMDLIMYGKVNGRPHWLEVFKAALNLMGHDVGEPRKPMGKLLPEAEERLRGVLKTMRVL
jgi:4-hydroxy-tetrahydrodipicolinate synthase